MAESDTLVLADGMSLIAPGGLYLPDTQTLVMADLHAGYVATLQKRGYTLPSQDDADLHARLHSLCERTQPRTVVVAGDLVHGAGALRSSTGAASALDALIAVMAGRALVVVPGNHDRSVLGALAARGVSMVEAYTAGASVVMHGDAPVEVSCRARAEALVRGGRLIVGHHHPALTLNDRAGGRGRVPAFAYAPGFVCLPALTPLARGADLLRYDYATELTAVVDAGELSLAVVVGMRVIPVGTLARVRTQY